MKPTTEHQAESVLWLSSTGEHAPSEQGFVLIAVESSFPAIAAYHTIPSQLIPIKRMKLTPEYNIDPYKLFMKPVTIMEKSMKSRKG